jgi:hypothetical protein
VRERERELSGEKCAAAETTLGYVSKKIFHQFHFSSFIFFLAFFLSFFVRCLLLVLVVAFAFVTVFIINGEMCGNEDVSDDVLMGCIVYEIQLYMRKGSSILFSGSTR